MITGLVAFLNVLRGGRSEADRRAPRRAAPTRLVGAWVGCLGYYHNGRTKGGRTRECKTATEILHGDYGCRLIAAKLLRGAVKSDVH